MLVLAVVWGLERWQHRDRPWVPGDLSDTNVLLVSLDTTRPDRLAGAGGGPVPTPALDRVAGGGFRFLEMVSPVPITLPAHASLFTGLDPHRHGVRENTEYALPPHLPTLAEAMEAAGYRTAAFVAAFVMDSRFGLARGFETYQDRLDGPEPGLRLGQVELPGAIVATRTAAWIHDHARRRRTGDEDRPFFLFTHFFDAHAPYRPPATFAAQHPESPYHGELAYQDQVLGQVLDALEASGEAARTLVWVVSDHGESLGEHGESTHSLFVYDATLRAVSVLRPPPEDGRFLAGPVRMDLRASSSLIDVPVTLASLLSVAPEGFGRNLDGRDLSPLLAGHAMPVATGDERRRSRRDTSESEASGEGTGETGLERTVYAETLSPYVSYHWAPLHAVRTPQWKFVRAPIPELYDLRADPGETNNLAAARPEVRARLEEALDRHLARANDSLADRAQSRDDAASSARREATEEEKERLRSLGYLSGSPAEPDDEEPLPDPKRMVAFFNDRFQQAKNLLYAGRFEDAIDAFQGALRIDPLNNSIHLYLAGAYRQAGRYQEASGAYRGAIEIAPGSPRAWLGWGRALLAAGHADSAVAAFEQAISLLPTSPDHWVALGEAEYRRGRFREAAAALDSSLVRGGTTAWAHGLLARIYLEHLERPELGARHLESYARGAGIDPEAARGRLPEP